MGLGDSGVRVLPRMCSASCGGLDIMYAKRQAQGASGGALALCTVKRQLKASTAARSFGGQSEGVGRREAWDCTSSDQCSSSSSGANCPVRREGSRRWRQEEKRRAAQEGRARHWGSGRSWGGLGKPMQTRQATDARRAVGGSEGRPGDEVIRWEWAGRGGEEEQVW